MKVICRHCGNLVDEKEAIKMTAAEYILFEFDKRMKEQPDLQGFCSYYEQDHHRSTQICQPCWKNK